ncbi:hypothetical protein [Neotabrizicola sp. VNH66]|uniref:hypothetical protein n=1 Tax=Neotabrizicola sp. VNH66 TaxID=3400918 RepID=UPI003C030750
MQNPRILPAARILRAETATTGRRFAAGLTAGAAALALVLAAAIPAPARADSDDLAKALIGALVVGAIIHETKKKDKPAPAPAPEPVKKPRGQRIPAYCAISIDGARNNVTLYPESCLRDEGVRGELPRDCASRATIFGERDRVYGEDCLARAGFILPGDRRY